MFIMCLCFWFTATGVLPQLAKFPVGNQLDVSYSPMPIKVFQILKILVGASFQSIDRVGHINKNRNNKICYFHGGCFIFVRNE